MVTLFFGHSLKSELACISEMEIGPFELMLGLCIDDFSPCYDRTPNRDKGQNEGFVLAAGSQICSVAAGKLWQWCLKQLLTSHCHQEMKGLCLFVQSRTPVPGMGPPIFGIGLPTSVTTAWGGPLQRPTEICLLEDFRFCQTDNNINSKQYDNGATMLASGRSQRKATSEWQSLWPLGFHVHS